MEQKTRDLGRVKILLRKAVAEGTTEEEARTCAFYAAKLIERHKFSITEGTEFGRHDAAPTADAYTAGLWDFLIRNATVPYSGSYAAISRERANRPGKCLHCQARYSTSDDVFLVEDFNGYVHVHCAHVFFSSKG